MSQSAKSQSPNFVIFLALLFGWLLLHPYIMGTAKEEEKPPVSAEKVVETEDGKLKTEKTAPTETAATGEQKTTPAIQPEAKPAALTESVASKKTTLAPGQVVPPTKPQDTWVTLGSADPDDPYRMLVTLSDRGASVVRMELNSPRYRQLMDDNGFLADRSGFLGRLTKPNAASGKGLRVDIVGPGTPAAKAGIQVGDLITAVQERPVTGPATFRKAMSKTRPGKTVKVELLRDGKEMAVEATLTVPPIEVVRPEGDDPLSFLATLSQIGDEKLPEIKPNPEAPKNELPSHLNEELSGLNLRGGSWDLVEHDTEKAVFACDLPTHGIRLVKTYRLVKVPEDQIKNVDYKAYNLIFDLEVINTADTTRKLAYQLDGPTGLPIEGWWYAQKVARCSGAGLRDVIASFDQQKPIMVGCFTISDGKTDPAWREESLTFIGVDAQYFSCILQPQKANPEDTWLARSMPIRVGSVDEKRKNLTNVTCRLRSLPKKLAPGESISNRYEIFTGPKRPALVDQYGLGSLVYYGWFDWIAYPMVKTLHFFHAIIRNYGLAIILLTVLVRLLMFPLSKKQALGAAKMAELQPEMKRIQEKYKKDAEGRTKAQQELFKKHNYNPLSGCLVLFIQMPIFIGLFRGLGVDVELRGSALLGSKVWWCSNLAAPDMLINWTSWMPDIITHGTNFLMLGPYFNLLPILTIFLFIGQQKMMMPPAADEQQAMQQKMMKYMMVFMGLLFFKVASGLCIYFIASSLWGVAERKLLPKHEHQKQEHAHEVEAAKKAEARKEITERRKKRGKKR